MKNFLKLAGTCAALTLAPLASHAAVEYVKVCSLYGAGFSYIPGTDICRHDVTGDTRVQTEGGTWRSITPYPEGVWAKQAQAECNGETKVLGTFSVADFLPANVWNRRQTRPIPLALKSNEFVSRISMTGGFFDPRQPNRHAFNNMDGLCVRSVDPSVMEPQGEGGSVNPPFGNGMLPIGCISNSRIVNMPSWYTINATSAYPSIDSYFNDAAQDQLAGPYTYGKSLVVTTDFGGAGFYNQLAYGDAHSPGVAIPLAGSVTVAACVQSTPRINR